MSPRDLAVLAQRIIEEFPEYYPYFAEKSFRYNKIKQGNRNPLLYRDTGADGLKTGHTRASGYGLVASAVRNGRRVMMVLTGLPSARTRSFEARRLLDWAYQSFKNYNLFQNGAVVENADVWLGEDETVPLVAERDVKISLPRASRRGLKAKVVYEGPVPAPIAKGTKIASLVITAPDFDTIEVPLVAGADVARVGIFGRLGAAIFLHGLGRRSLTGISAVSRLKPLAFPRLADWLCRGNPTNATVNCCDGGYHLGSCRGYARSYRAPCRFPYTCPIDKETNR